MRQKNWRVIATGIALVILAGAFFVFAMLFMAPQSNAPSELMSTVGTVSGAAGGIGLVMAIFGFVGKKKTA